jgi:hypothetical protein
LSPITAAGNPPIKTVGAPGPITGPPTCGIGDGNAGVCIGQVCISVILAAFMIQMKIERLKAEGFGYFYNLVFLINYIYFSSFSFCLLVF